jgi:hypothetical protein
MTVTERPEKIEFLMLNNEIRTIKVGKFHCTPEQAPFHVYKRLAEGPEYQCVAGGEHGLTYAIKPQFYFGWGNEPSGHVSIGRYENDVYKSMGTMLQAEAKNLGLKYHCPYP